MQLEFRTDASAQMHAYVAFTLIFHA